MPPRLGEYRNCLHCGKEFYATRVQIKLNQGKCCSRSCATYATSGMRKHGHNGLKRSPTYNVWAGIIQRCHNPKNKAYAYYGGRGITVCDRWRQYENFLADMGERPGELTLERRDNAKGYEPGNCYWATRKEQMRNTRWNKLVMYNGRTQCVSAWIEETGIPRGTMAYRLSQSLDSFAISIPIPIGDSLVEMEEV